MLRADVLKVVLPPQIKSILKPTIPLSPPKAIPPHNEARKAPSPTKSKAQRTPEKSPMRSPVKSAGKGSRGSLDPFKASPASPTKEARSSSRLPARIAVRTEEEQQAAAKERERQEMLAHKEARRKSLGIQPSF